MYYAVRLHCLLPPQQISVEYQNAFKVPDHKMSTLRKLIPNLLCMKITQEQQLKHRLLGLTGFNRSGLEPRNLHYNKHIDDFAGGGLSALKHGL